MFPTQIIGISVLLLFLKDCRNLSIENKTKYISENGKKTKEQKDKKDKKERDEKNMENKMWLICNKRTNDKNQK